MDTENAEEAGTSWSHLGNALLEADPPILESQMEKDEPGVCADFLGQQRPSLCLFQTRAPLLTFKFKATGLFQEHVAHKACLVTSYWSSWTTEGAGLMTLIFLPLLPQMQPAYRKSDQTWVAKWLLEGTRFGWA